MTKAATIRKPAVSHIQRKLIPSYIFLTIMSILSVFPLYWMFTAATNTSLEVAQGKVWFGNYLAENYKNLIDQQNLWQAMGNSFFYAIVQTLATLLICSLAGYGFELYHDRGKDRLFAILLLAMMVPQVATLIPLFTMISQMKLLNSVLAFIIPGLATPFMIMMFRQNSRNFPMDTMEAARIVIANAVTDRSIQDDTTGRKRCLSTGSLRCIRQIIQNHHRKGNIGIVVYQSGLLDELVSLRRRIIEGHLLG